MFDTYENWFEVVCPANGGFTVLRMVGPNGKPYDVGTMEIPTEVIPIDLRQIGSRFLLQWGNINADTAEQIRRNKSAFYKVIRALETDAPDIFKY